MKLEIQRVNQKINKIEELMTTFLEQVSKNSLQVPNQLSITDQVKFLNSNCQALIQTQISTKYSQLFGLD